MKPRNRTTGIVLSAVASLVLTGSLAQAQSNTKGFGAKLTQDFSARTNSSRFTSKGIRSQLASSSVKGRTTPRPNLGSYSRSSSGFSSKPFSTISRTPTVSPYIALNNSFNQVSDYYNIVRPQREQRRVNQQLQRQNQANQRRLNQMAAKGPYSPRGDETSAPTGHTAVFQSLGTYLQTGGYYPGAPIAK